MKKEQSAAVIQMVWNGRVSAHDFCETTRIFYEKDDFSVSDTGNSEEKNPSLPKGRFRQYDFCLQLSYTTDMRYDFMTDHVM